jgi:hypothetical protein
MRNVSFSLASNRKSETQYVQLTTILRNELVTHIPSMHGIKLCPAKMHLQDQKECHIILRTVNEFLQCT